MSMADAVFNIGTDGYPVPINAPEIPEKYMSKPYPKSFWRIEEQGEYPCNDLMPELPTLGAFSNATGLKKAVIPESVKYIGREAFRNTQLSSVTIASDCDYYDTSFPKDCTINYYH